MLSIAMLVTPGATAFLLTDRLPGMMLIASLVSVGASVGGMYVSFYFNLPSGAVIVMIATLAFFAAMFVGP